MPFSRDWWTILVAGVVTLQLGCGKKIAVRQPAPVPASALPPVQLATQAPPAPPLPPPSAPTPRPVLSDADRFMRMSLAELNATQPLGDAFFAYDETTLNEIALKTLQRDATWLRQWRSTRVLVEGHADERGTQEYNLALAESRARTVTDYLVGLGVEKSRISLVSKGEEQPFCATRSEDDCWGLNRRAHFIITAK